MAPTLSHPLTRVLAAALTLICARFASGQPNPDFWNEIRNPNGQRIVPDITYDPTSGKLMLDTLGMNGVDETPDYTNVGGPIRGDDVGAIAILVEVSYPHGWYYAPFTGLALEQMIASASQYFNGKYQSIGQTLWISSNQFLWPGTYDFVGGLPGLTAADFGTCEVAVNLEPLSPGAVLRGAPGCVRIVPEPTAGSTLVVIAVFMLMRPLRRHGRLLPESNSGRLRHSAIATNSPPRFAQFAFAPTAVGANEAL